LGVGIGYANFVYANGDYPISKFLLPRFEGVFQVFAGAVVFDFDKFFGSSLGAEVLQIFKEGDQRLLI
jgi:hypothetical protein